MEGRSFPCDGCPDRAVCESHEGCWRSEPPFRGRHDELATYAPSPELEDLSRHPAVVIEDGQAVAFLNMTAGDVVEEILQATGWAKISASLLHRYVNMTAGRWPQWSPYRKEACGHTLPCRVHGWSQPEAGYYERGEPTVNAFDFMASHTAPVGGGPAEDVRRAWESLLGATGGR